MIKNFFDYISQFGGYNYTEEFVKALRDRANKIIKKLI